MRLSGTETAHGLDGHVIVQHIDTHIQIRLPTARGVFRLMEVGNTARLDIVTDHPRPGPLGPPVAGLALVGSGFLDAESGLERFPDIAAAESCRSRRKAIVSRRSSASRVRAGSYPKTLDLYHRRACVRRHQITQAWSCQVLESRSLCTVRLYISCSDWPIARAPHYGKRAFWPPLANRNVHYCITIADEDAADKPGRKELQEKR